MTSYILKRLVLSLLTVWMVATITFFLMYLVPGGPFLSEKAPSQAVLDSMYAKYGLDKPLYIQYGNYMIHAAQGDLGDSYKKKGRTVAEIIGEKFPVSAKIGGIAIVASIMLGIPLGAVSALKRGKWEDNLLRFIFTLGIAVPGFVVATSLMIVFGVKIPILPTYGLTSPAHYILPVITLTLYPMAYIARLMRSSMLDVLGQDYIRTARAKGLSGRVVLFKHALRNSLIPIITYLGPLIAYILTGSFVVEKIFTIPGLGGEFISSITNRDYPLVMGTTIFLAAFLIMMNLLVDILYKVVDPRIKFD